MNLWDHIRIVKDFPIKGIEFLDLTTIWKNPDVFKKSIDIISDKLKNQKIDKIAAIESRGFVIASPIAYNLSLGFIPIRKKGKLPAGTIQESYELEYGEATLEMHRDAIDKDDRIVLIDDVLATGGTAKACQNMINVLGGKLVSSIFLLEIKALNGRKKLNGEVISILEK